MKNLIVILSLIGATTLATADSIKRGPIVPKPGGNSLIATCGALKFHGLDNTAGHKETFMIQQLVMEGGSPLRLVVIPAKAQTALPPTYIPMQLVSQPRDLPQHGQLGDGIYKYSAGDYDVMIGQKNGKRNFAQVELASNSNLSSICKMSK